MSSTSPYNLIDAFEVLNQGRQNSVDILGIVSNISCSDDAQRCQIWLLDESLHDDHSTLSSPQSNASAHIVLYGSSEMARVEQETIRPGDILRLNRVVLKRSTNITTTKSDNRDGKICYSDSSGTGERSKTWEGSLQFQFSSHDPEPGLSWYCLGCIDSHGKFIGKNCDVGATLQVGTSRIPENMITSRERIKRLVDWYNNHPNHRAHPGYSSTINSNIKTSTSTISREINSQLITLPCRKRTLDEIYNSVGSTSNIQIRVKQYYSQPATVVVNTGRTYGKNKKRQHKIFPPVVFAVVTDDSGTMMTFIDTTGRFLSKLQSASKNDISNKKLLLLTNVSTVYQNSLRGLKSSSKEIVLIPTKTTSGLLISQHDRNNREGNISSISVPNNSGQETQEEIISDMEMNVISSLVDIHIDGISLKDSCINNSDQSVFSTTTQYLKTILENDRHAYKSAIIYLDNDDDIGQAIASPDVMESLCGSLDVTELLENNDTLCTHSMRFLRALILEHVILKWTIYIDDDNELKIAKAVLHQLSE